MIWISSGACMAMVVAAQSEQMRVEGCTERGPGALLDLMPDRVAAHLGAVPGHPQAGDRARSGLAAPGRQDRTIGGQVVLQAGDELGRERHLQRLAGLGLLGRKLQPPVRAAPDQMSAALDGGQVLGPDRPIRQKGDQQAVAIGHRAHRQLLLGLGLGPNYQLAAQGHQPLRGLQTSALVAHRNRLGLDPIRSAPRWIQRQSCSGHGTHGVAQLLDTRGDRERRHGFPKMGQIGGKACMGEPHGRAWPGDRAPPVGSARSASGHIPRRSSGGSTPPSLWRPRPDRAGRLAARRLARPAGRSAANPQASRCGGKYLTRS